MVDNVRIARIMSILQRIFKAPDTSSLYQNAYTSALFLSYIYIFVVTEKHPRDEGVASTLHSYSRQTRHSVFVLADRILTRFKTKFKTKEGGAPTSPFVSLQSAASVLRVGRRASRILLNTVRPFRRHRPVFGEEYKIVIAMNNGR